MVCRTVQAGCTFNFQHPRRLRMFHLGPDWHRYPRSNQRREGTMQVSFEKVTRLRLYRLSTGCGGGSTAKTHKEIRDRRVPYEEPSGPIQRHVRPGVCHLTHRGPRDYTLWGGRASRICQLLCLLTQRCSSVRSSIRYVDGHRTFVRRALPLR